MSWLVQYEINDNQCIGHKYNLSQFYSELQVAVSLIYGKVTNGQRDHKSPGRGITGNQFHHAPIRPSTSLCPPPTVVFMRHRNSTDFIGLAKTIAALSPDGDKKPRYVAEYSALIGQNRHMLLLPIKLPSDGTRHAHNRANENRDSILHRYVMHLLEDWDSKIAKLGMRNSSQ